MCSSFRDLMNVFVERFARTTSFIYLRVLRVFQLDRQVGVELRLHPLLQLIFQVVQTVRPISPDGKREYKK